ncbi:hypothetical protein CLPU_6c01790 [Gottschalkia purinilytica]|uniref:Ribosomal protein L7/L12 C-terminal domain-containing protein n=1 Tax=Gottschalkia purinilytica TaxID=1503 RepID=A0A0L0WB21_GOTPU|nr:hypothetical protein [Gottschalkia purinilytica]KNF08693.1 hypothetical protein CLPU_6c01790 [Gottschalkia purinilytica]
MNIFLTILSGILIIILVLEKTSNSKKELKRKIEQLENEILLLKKGEIRELDDEVRILLCENQHVKAIKLVRETLGFDLLKAKKYVDNIEDEDNCKK